MNALQAVKSHLEPGKVYRRADIGRWTNAVDRHLSRLQQEKALIKLQHGMYYCPKESVFGNTPPNERDMIEKFLKDHRFLVSSANAYNSLGVGTTQLYNETIVYNHKRHGLFKLGNRTMRFVVKHHFPSKVSREFLLVDLVDNIDRLAEDREAVLNFVKKVVEVMDLLPLKQAIQHYGSVKTRKYFAALLMDESISYGA